MIPLAPARLHIWKIYATLLFPVLWISSVPASAAEPRDERLWERAMKLHRSAIVIDGHNDITSPMLDENYDLGVSSAGKFHTDLARLKEGGVTAQFFAIFVDNEFVTNHAGARRALEMIDVLRRTVELHSDKLVFATSVADIRQAKKRGRIAALMGVENGAAIENSLGTLRAFHQLGVRYMTLTHILPNDWADSSTSPARHNGLTEFGRSVVREMSRLGMMVDVSHVSDKTMSAVLDVTSAPIIASHSSARALASHPRNIPDELLRRIAANGGIVMVNFFTGYIDPRTQSALDTLQPKVDALREQFKSDSKQFHAQRARLYETELPRTPLSILIDHIEHIIRIAGVDHVGLGSDFDGISTVPEGLEDVSRFPNITYELLKRGHSEADVRKILGENFLRVFAEVQRRASSIDRNAAAQSR
jgi:membrane dipeptidase